MRVWVIEEIIIRGREPESNITFLSETFPAVVGWLADHNVPHHLGDSVVDGRNITVEPYGDQEFDDRQLRIVADNGDVWIVTRHEVE